MTTIKLFITQTISLILIVVFYYNYAAPLDNVSHEIDAYFADRFDLAVFVFALYGFLFSLIYFITRQNLNNKLGLTHFALGLPLFLLTFTEQLGFYNHNSIPRRYYSNYESKLFDVFPIYNSSVYQFTLALFVLGIVAFVLNLTLKHVTN